MTLVIVVVVVLVVVVDVVCVLFNYLNSCVFACSCMVVCFVNLSLWVLSNAILKINAPPHLNALSNTNLATNLVFNIVLFCSCSFGVFGWLGQSAYF